MFELNLIESLKISQIEATNMWKKFESYRKLPRVFDSKKVRPNRGLTHFLVTDDNFSS
jgi:hypothetical protein